MDAAPSTDRGTLRDWLLHDVCPFWFERLLDPAGGFYEALDEQSQAVVSPERTILNQARLTYTASHAWLMGRDGRMLQAAHHGFAILKKACEPAGAAAGWPRKFCPDGTVVDAARDAYDQAFVLFGLAWYYRATGNPQALDMAREAYAFMQARLADGLHGGFFEEYPQTGKLPRRQNPHMHLLEALLALHAATGEGRWLAEAARLTSLFEAHFFDAESGSLAEYFQADWTVQNGDPGALREPGHQFEWVWLLGDYAKQSGDARYASLAGRLYTFGTQFGIDRQDGLGGAVMDGLNAQGGIVAATKLLWPQTEYIKVCVAMFENTGETRYLDTARAHVELLRRHFFRADGLNWCNQLARGGEMLPGATPSRVLYHLFLALAELVRVEPAA